MSHTVIRAGGNKRSKTGLGLIMTATLIPPSKAVARSDPEHRLRDYLDALGFYLDLADEVIDRILFIDNSNSDLTPLVNFVTEFKTSKCVELIGFNGNDHPHELGKAYGEFKLMDFGLEHTTLFSPNDVVWKTTGRLKLLNLAELTKKTMAMDFDILCDMHNVPLVSSGKWTGFRYVDLRTFSFRVSAYEKLLQGLWKTNRTNLNAEFLYSHLLAHIHNEKIFCRFPIQPQLQGISGRHLRDYQSGSQRLKDSVRTLARRLTPWFWI